MGGGRACAVCGLVSATYTLFRKHRATHVDKRCAQCGHTFKTLRNLRRHAQLVHGKATCRYVPCRVCGKLVNEMYLRQHVKSSHSVRVKACACDVCGKLYKDAKSVRSHKLAVHVDEQDYVQCRHCDKRFKTKHTLNCHVESVHLNKTTGVCEKCGVTVKYIARHLESCQPKEHTKVTCDVCGKLCLSHRCLQRHKMIHTDERRHMCDICGLKFKTSFTLKNHAKVHTDQRNYPCQLCDKTFKYSTVLKTHQRVHNDATPFVCCQCGDRFKWRSSYEKHAVKCDSNNS